MLYAGDTLCVEKPRCQALAPGLQASDRSPLRCKGKRSKLTRQHTHITRSSLCCYIVSDGRYSCCMCVWFRVCVHIYIYTYLYMHIVFFIAHIYIYASPPRKIHVFPPCCASTAQHSTSNNSKKQSFRPNALTLCTENP